jgi:hypothetical protein
MPNSPLHSAKQVSIGQRIPLTRTKVESGVWMGALRRLKLPFRLRGFTTDFAPDHHPHFWTRQTIERQHRAQHEEIGDQRAFVPLKPPKPLPGGRGPLLGQLLHRHFGRTRGMQPLSLGGRSFARRGLRGHPTAWTRTLCLPIGFQERPDLRISRNLSQVPQSCCGQALQEGGRVAISLVTHHPARFDPLGSHDLLDQLGCQLMLGLCRRSRRESDSPA